MRAGLGVVLVLAAVTASASELDFTYATRMPEVQGDLRSEVNAVDAERGLSVTKTVFALEYGNGAILTHVAAARCGAADVPPLPYMIALQLVPKTFETFAQATLLDGFTEVYVTDEAHRIRVYRNVPGYVMAELSERFQPVCLGI